MEHSLDELLDGMASPDPTVRDGWAYAELSGGVEDGSLAAHHDVIRERAVAHLSSPDLHVRTFAPLMLCWLLEAGDRDRASYDAFASWYATEPDTRAWDGEIGWLHAVAHGADYLGDAVTAGVAEPAEALDLLTARVLAPGGVWLAQEESRLAVAAVQALVLSDVATAATWVGPLHRAVTHWQETRTPGDPWPATIANIRALATTLYVALAEQPTVHRAPVTVPEDVAREVMTALAELVGAATPWLVQARPRS